MKTVLLISSQVASSCVGASAGAFALQRMGIEVITLPTVLLGRHPGWGDPGRVDVDADGLARLFLAVQEQGLLERVDAVITGYFRSSLQVRAAAAMIEYVRKARPDVMVVVDPVMGDEPDGLYVADAVAEAIRRELLPCAGIITPNAWELSHLADRDVFDEASAVDAARATGCPLVLASSVPSGSQIATLSVEAGQVWAASVPRYKAVPHGTGDVLTALFSAHLLHGRPVRNALQSAVSSVDSILAEARRLHADELPLVAAQDYLVNPMAGLNVYQPLLSRRPARWVAGMNACSDGWIAVMLDATGQNAPRVHPLRGFWDVLQTPERPETVAVNMPIGFAAGTDAAGRQCEIQVRELLAARSASVFAAPNRRALYCTSYESACAANASGSKTAVKLSQQVYGLFDKMREIDARITPGLQAQIFEAHPELSFALMRGGEPCAHPGSTKAGLEERVQALREARFDADFLNTSSFTPLHASREDFLDACACAWTAQRILLGAAQRFPETDERDSNGLEMAIRG